MKSIILGAGCNWCSEALFKSLNGVLNLKPGYYSIANTIHALNKKDKIEVVYFDYDETILSTHDLINFFFNTHNPGLISWDENSFYPAGRSVIFYFNEEDKIIFNNFLDNLKSKTSEPIYTKILQVDIKEFSLNEDKYIDYYKKYPTEAFSVSNIEPKIKKIKDKFSNLLKL